MDIKNIKNFREIDFKYEDLLKNKEELEELIAKRKNTYEVASKLFQDNGEDVTTLDKLKDEISENENTLVVYNETINSLSPVMNMMQEVTDMSTNYMIDIRRALETGNYSVEELKNNANKINVEVSKVLAAERENSKEQIIHIVKESDLNRVFAGVTWAVTRSVKLLTDNYITTNDKINELEESKSKLKEELANKTNRYQELIDNVNNDKDILEINTLDEEITSIRSELNSTIKELLDYNKNKEDILSEIESYIGSYAPKEEVKEETLENNELEEEKIETPSDVIDAEFSENKENNNDKKELKEEKLENKESEEVDIPEEIEAINEEEVEDLSKADERTLMPKKPKVKDVSQSTNLYEIAEEVEVKPEEIMPSTPSLNNDLDYSFMDRVSSGKVSDKLMGEIKDTINEKEAIKKDNELDYSFVNMVNKNADNIVAYNGPSTKDIVKATENYVAASKKEESSHKFSIKGKLSKWIFKAVLAGVAAIGLYFGLTNKNETTATMSTLEIAPETGEHERVRTSLAVQDGAVYIKYTDGISEKVSVVDTNGNLLPAGTEIFDARGTSYTIERYETAYNSTGSYIVAIVSASILAMNAAKDFKNKLNGSQQPNVSEDHENVINNESLPSNKLENTQELEPVQAHNTEKFVPPMEVPVGAEEISNDDILKSVEENDTDTLVVDDDMFVPPMELPDENPFEVKNVSNTKEKIKKLVNDINAVNIGSGAYYNGSIKEQEKGQTSGGWVVYGKTNSDIEEYRTLKGSANPTDEKVSPMDPMISNFTERKKGVFESLGFTIENHLKEALNPLSVSWTGVTTALDYKASKVADKYLPIGTVTNYVGMIAADSNIKKYGITGAEARVKMDIAYVGGMLVIGKKVKPVVNTIGVHFGDYEFNNAKNVVAPPLSQEAIQKDIDERFEEALHTTTM